MKILFILFPLILMLPAVAAPENAARSVLIKSEPLLKKKMGKSLTAYGSVMPSTGATENISFPRAGQIARLYVSAGQTVKRGQALLEFSTDPNAAALYHQAETTAVFARGELKRIEDLTSRQLATQSQLAAAKKALQDAEANLAAQKNIGAGVAALKVAASFDGVVSQLTVQQGDRVAAGAFVMQLSRAGQLRATLGIEPEDIARLRLGMQVEVFSVFGDQAPVLSRVLQIHGALNPLTHLVDIEVELQAGGFLAGMPVRGVIALDKHESWAVPRSAVLRDEQGSFLFQIKDRHAVRIPVTIDAESGDSLAVSGALDGSLNVVVSGNYELQDGMMVRESNP